VANGPSALADVTQIHPQVYPNPANGFIELSHVPQEMQSMRIYDSMGNMILESLNTDSKWIPISHLIPGIYFLQIASTDGAGVVRFVIAR
jgi:hypothetical protein